MVIHNTDERPLIDEFGVAINPATYTLAAITEVIQEKYCIVVLPITGNKSNKHYILRLQTKIHRQEDPYPSNCTRSWESTNFTDIVQDPVDGGFGENAVNYNMAVSI